jgi:hypothetical protein
MTERKCRRPCQKSVSRYACLAMDISTFCAWYSYQESVRSFQTLSSRLFIFIGLCVKSRNSSVGIALGYGLDNRGSGVRFPAEAGNFSLHHRVQNGSGVHPASYPMGTRGSFPGVKRPGRESDHSPPSSAEVKELVELYLHSPNTPSWRGAQLKHRDNFTFTFIGLCVTVETILLLTEVINNRDTTMNTRAMKLTAHLHLERRLRMRGAILPPPQYVFKAWYLVKQ